MCHVKFALFNYRSHARGKRDDSPAVWEVGGGGGGGGEEP